MTDTLRTAPALARMSDYSVKRQAIAEVLRDAGLPIIADKVLDDAEYCDRFIRAFQIVDAARNTAAALAKKEG